MIAIRNVFQGLDYSSLKKNEEQYQKWPARARSRRKEEKDQGNGLERGQLKPVNLEDALKHFSKETATMHIRPTMLLLLIVLFTTRVEAQPTRTELLQRKAALEKVKAELDQAIRKNAVIFLGGAGEIANGFEELGRITLPGPAGRAETWRSIVAKAVDAGKAWNRGDREKAYRLMKEAAREAIIEIGSEGGAYAKQVLDALHTISKIAIELRQFQNLHKSDELVKKKLGEVNNKLRAIAQQLSTHSNTASTPKRKINKPPVGPPPPPLPTEQGVEFNPENMSPQEREAWQRNQAIIARETLRRPAQGSSSSPSSQRLDPIWYDGWLRQGDSVFDNTPEMKDLFYKTYPQLDQPRYRNIARYRSPADEIDQDLANGTLSIDLANRSTSASGSTGQPTDTPFDPSLLSPQEREGWERNQANTGRETLRRSVQGSPGVSADAERPPTTPSARNNGKGSNVAKGSSAYKLRAAQQELQRHLDNSSDPRQPDPEFRQRMEDLGVRVVNPSSAVRNGTAEITGVARAGYSRADVQIINRTDDWLALDFSRAYLVPASGNSGSQRLGLVSVAQERVSLHLPERSPESHLAFSSWTSPEAGASEPSIKRRDSVVFIKAGLRLEESSFRSSVLPSYLLQQGNEEFGAWPMKHWVIMAPRSRALIPFHTVCLDHGRGIPGRDERFYMSDRPLPLKVQQILVAASLKGEVPQSKVWSTIADEHIKWHDPRVPVPIRTPDSVMLRSMLKGFDVGFAGSRDPALQACFTQAKIQLQQQNPKGALFQFQRAYQLAPNSPIVNFNLSLLYQAQDQLISALNHAQTYLKLAPQALDGEDVETRIADLEDELKRHPRAQYDPAHCQDIFDWAQTEQQVAKRSGSVGRRQAIMEILISSQRGDCENSRSRAASYRQRYQ